MDLGLSGLISGLDWRTLVDQLAEAERAPQRRLQTEQSTLEKQKTAYASINTQLVALQAKVAALKESSLFDSRVARVGVTGDATRRNRWYSAMPIITSVATRAPKSNG